MWGHFVPLCQKEGDKTNADSMSWLTSALTKNFFFPQFLSDFASLLPPKCGKEGLKGPGRYS